MSEPIINSSRLSSINMKKIYDEEDDDNFLFSIREEIIQNAMNEIDKINRDKDVLTLVADCAIEALKKVIVVQFCYHIGIVDVSQPPWSADEPLAPSPPDPWTTKMVSISRTTVTDVEQLEVAEELKMCECQLGVDCLCLKTPDERIEAPMKVFFKKTKPKKKKTYRLSLSTASSDKASITTDALEAPPVTEHSPVNEQKDESIQCVLSDIRTEATEEEESFKLPKIDSSLSPTPAVVKSKSEPKVVPLSLPPIRGKPSQKVLTICH